MIIMTEGLQTLAGDAMRKALVRFTHTPLSGAITGAVSTAILQSSSATTVAVVGFVGAGLMGFPESLGIIFGANIGTTLKGWVVATIGLQFQLGTLLLPLVFVGAFMRLFLHGRKASAGYALAGFAIIFVGIDLLQQGMSGLEGLVSPANFPPDTWWGRLQLLLLGLTATLITQSSSAGVATALTAVYTGTINFQQAAALVIGMDVGTTVTAAMATIGGSIGARRTGFSHVIYNLFTGVGALLLISPFSWVWEHMSAGGLQSHAEIALVAFHTTFNILGVIIVLPFTTQFARLLERLFPENIPAYLQHLDKALLEQPSVALTQVQAALSHEFITLLQHIAALLDDHSTYQLAQLSHLRTSLQKIHDYVDLIHVREMAGSDWERLVALIHAMDHMTRLHERCAEEEYRAKIARDTQAFTEQREIMLATIARIIVEVDKGNWTTTAQRADQMYQVLRDKESTYRQAVISRMGSGEIDIPSGTRQLQAIRWLRRVSHHIARVSEYVSQSLLAAGK
jgi:phosphate:Na+ symporter